MKIGILGTGTVGKTLGTRLVQLGHDVKMGSRTPDNEIAREWVHETRNGASQGTFADAASFGELVINCTKGMAVLEVLRSAGASNLEGKILMDVSNPLDSGHPFPPPMTICNDNSLGEEIQKHFPKTLVVKALNTMNCRIMVNPKLVNDGAHQAFICGNSAAAKAEVVVLLESFGWKAENILDLGDITNARGTEMLLPLWMRLVSVVGSSLFQFQIVK
jgi:predicted dinucleotide-binding enzyme